jgi:uncharacterized repeat protein (TIGR01451 family)
LIFIAEKKYKNINLTMITRTIKLVISICILFISSYRPASGQFPEWHNYTSNTGILDFELDGNDIWICTTGGLVKLNKSTGTHVNYNAGNYGLTQNEIYRIATDTAGTLFMGGPGYAQTFDKDTAWIFTDTLAANGTNMPTVGYCVADKIGNVYSSAGGYVIRYNNSQFDTLQVPFTGALQINGLAVDSSNNLWVSSLYFGIEKYDGSTWQVFDSTNSILPNQNALGICVDHNDKVYALYFLSANQGSLFSYSNGAWQLEQSGIFMNGGVYCEMYADATNNIWITSENSMINGIRKYDGTTITSYTTGSFGLPSNEINEFQIDDQGIWYYSTDYGFYSYDGVAHKQYQLSASGIPTNSIEKVVIDKYGVKWFASYYGVTRFDGYNWQTFNVANSTLSWDHITDIYADQDQDLIWVTFNPGNGNSGIAYYDGSNWNTITPTVSGGFDNGYSLTKDTNGNMWFIGSSGVAKFDYNTWTFYSNTMLNSTASNNIVADSSGNVYVSSYILGVWQYNGSSWQLFDSNDFPNGINSSVYLYSGPGGQVYAFTGLDGYVFNGTTWNNFNSSCNVQTPNTFIPAESSTGDLWLSDGEFASSFDGTTCEEFAVSRLPDLSGMVKSVAKDQHNNYWFTYFNSGGITVYHHDGIDPETLFGTPTKNASGFIFIDVASDGVFDTLTDIAYANQRVMLLPDSTMHFTNAQGIYNFAVVDGFYTIKVIPDSTWQVTTDSVEYHFAISGNDTTGFDFGMMGSNVPIDQMSIDVTTGIPRCNTSFPIFINYSNQGLMSQTGMLKFSCDNQLLINNSNPQPDSIVGNNWFWNISNLTTFHNGFITVSVAMDTFLIPPVTHLVNVEFIRSGISIVSDFKSFQGLCSLDPNDKTVTPEGVGATHEIASTQMLDYTIRFQNFGNDTAFYVMIIDTLDADLDFSTFQIKSSSHPCDVSLSSSGLLTVKFRKINLLWEAVDVAGSQGYFQYSISPLSGVANTTLITNSAAIYFDFNLPVITNEVFNTISYNILSFHSPESNDEIFVYPIPALNEIYLNGKDSHEILSYSIFDITGKQFYDEINWQHNQPINVANLHSGIYLLRLKSVSGKLNYARFVVNRIY